jgi:X-Pro dipeptidyl-peptidase
MRRPNAWTRLSVSAILAATALAGIPVTAVAEDPPAIVVDGGVTQPVFGYADAIRERVWVDADFDTNRDGVDDVLAADIIRPAATADGLKVPVIIDDSPYYSTLCRGAESECKQDFDGDGLNDKWPLFYDNYFVPRGYAIVLIDMTGTNKSTGCPTINDETENRSGPIVIDWLNGRRTAHDKDGNPVVVDWHNGKSAMIGKSYDGALAMAAAVDGVEGLATVVPIDGPYNYYDYTRSNGVIMRGNSYPVSLARTITNDNPVRQADCAPVWAEMAAADGDEHGDYNAFWDARNYLKDVDRVTASVWLVHGVQDENVRPDHFSKMWAELTAHDVPRKLWVGRIGHVEPFDFRRAVWVDTLHRWFDHWLYDIDNGIMDEPKADIERSTGVWESHADWPIPGTERTSVFLRVGATNGGLSVSADADAASTAFTDTPTQSENTMVNNPTNVTANRRVFLSDPLTAPLHVSGTVQVRLKASANQTDTNFGAILVDYGPSTQNSRTGDGWLTTTLPEECFGESSATDDGCYRPIAFRPTNVNQWRVTKGILDALNRNSLEVAEPLVPGQEYDFNFPLLPEDFIFPAGHRVGVVIVGSYPGYGSQADQTRAQITLNLQTSIIDLPIVGGYQAAVDAGIPDQTAPVVTVPDDIVVDAVSPAGVEVSYEASVTDAEDPNPDLACEPASGSVFPIGTTTVTCTGTDGAGNETVETFTIHVKGAPEQLADFAVELAGVGPGTAFADKAREIEALLLAGENELACNDLLHSFPAMVQAQVTKKPRLPPAQAEAILAEIAHIATVAGCG